MDNAQLFEKMLTAMVGSDTPVPCHPISLRYGDRIRYSGVDCIVTMIERKSRSWFITIRYVDAKETSHSYYVHDGEMVSRYLAG